MKTPKEILLEIVPKDCYWEDMDNLTNTPIYYVIEAMENYAKQKLQQHVVMQGWPDFQTAKRLLAIRDELVKGDTHEAYHQLCLIADPELENLNHWQKLETIAQGQPSVASEGLDKNA